MKRPLFLRSSLLCAALLAFAGLLTVIGFASGSTAQPFGQNGTATTVMAGDATHPPLTLTPDKSHLLRLDRAAGTIIVGNEAHLGVLLDTPQTAVLVPRAPGATYFTVLDGNRNVIMQRHVLVAAPEEHYIRIRRSCANAAAGCRETSVYYCPEMCHEVAITPGLRVSGTGEAQAGMPSPAPATGGASGSPSGLQGHYEGGGMNGDMGADFEMEADTPQ